METLKKFNEWLHEQGHSREKWITVIIVALAVGGVAYVSGYLDGFF